MCDIIPRVTVGGLVFCMQFYFLRAKELLIMNIKNLYRMSEQSDIEGRYNECNSNN